MTKVPKKKRYLKLQPDWLQEDSLPGDKISQNMKRAN